MPLPKRKKEEQVMEYSFENIGTGTIPVMAEMRYRIGNKKGWIWVGVYLLLDLYYLRKFMIGDLPLVFALIFIGITLYLVMLPYLRLRKAYKKEKAFYDGVIPELTTRFGENIYISNTAASRTMEFHRIKKVYSLKYSYCLRFTDDTVLMLGRENFTKGTFLEFKQFLREKRPDLKIPE
jgi:glycosyltransferase involved in cell wall biosynthesis